MTIDDLHDLAAAIGARVESHAAGPKGRYIHQARTISIRCDLGPTRYRCTLAHELAHAIRGDIPSGNPHFDARAERAADQIAAELLISHSDYAAAEAIYGPHTGAIARELGVTTHLLAVWRELFERARA